MSAIRRTTEILLGTSDACFWPLADKSSKCAIRPLRAKNGRVVYPNSPVMHRNLALASGLYCFFELPLLCSTCGLACKLLLHQSPGIKKPIIWRMLLSANNPIFVKVVSCPPVLVPCLQVGASAIVIGSVAVIGINSGMLTPLIALRAEAAGVSTSWNGVLAAAPSLAILLLGSTFPSTIRRLGVLQSFYFSTALAVISTLMFPLLAITGYGYC